MKHAHEGTVPKTRHETPQLRRAEYYKAALNCLKNGQKIAAEALFLCAVRENSKLWSSHHAH